MGNTPNNYSFEELNPEKYERIRLSPTSKLCGQCSTVSFPFDEKPSSLCDDSALWDEFGKEIDELLPLLNRYSLPVFVMTPILMVLAGFLAFFLTYSTPNTNDDNGEDNIDDESRTISSSSTKVFITVGIAFFGVGCLSVLARIKIHHCNQQVDQKIREICANYTSRFHMHSGNGNSKKIIPEYRTKWTEEAAKGAIARRMIVFIPASSPSSLGDDDSV